MSGNIFISNGTCYSAAGQQADDAIIPCGNAVHGPLTCCQQGDMCLSSQACYNDEFGVTYLAGCSDPEYEDDSCPDKGSFEDEPWVGLVYCNGTSEEWFACSQSGSPDTLTSPDDCWCPQEPRTVAFTASSILDGRVRLGSSLGESVIWMPGNVPTTPPDEDDDEDETASASATSSSPVTLLITQSPPSIPSSEPPTTGTPSPTSIVPIETSPAETAEPEDGAGLAESARIGIGVGVGVGVSSAILLIALGVFLYLRRRRKQRPDGGEAPAKPSYDNPLPPLPLPPQHATGGPSELDSGAARPWSMRSELPDTPRSVAAEMESPGRSAWREKMDGVSNGRVSGPMGERRMHTGPVAELPG